MKISLLFFLLVAVSANAAENCELTDEYKRVRKEVRDIVYGDNNDYGKCRNAAFNTEYWLALSKCVENGDGENIGGGCAHLVGRGKYLQPADTSHCEVFKLEPTRELAQSLLRQIVQERSVEKCTNT